MDCKDIRAHRVLEFLVPILYSKKPTRVMIILANIILRTLSREHSIDWGVVIWDVV